MSVPTGRGTTITSNPAMMSFDCPHPVSRTYQYKKVTKPLLERKRRARINRCLDELKDLMVDALETEGEDISKLEKADILELTVRHLQRLQAARTSGQPLKNDETSGENRWLSGFGHCAAEACRFLSGLPGEASDRLARHLAAGLQTTRHTNSPINLQVKANLVSPSLANLELTANLIAPSPSKPSDDNIEITKTKLSSQRMTPYPEVNPERTSPKVDGRSPVPTTLSSLEIDQKLQLNETIITEFSRDKIAVEKHKSNDSNSNDDDEEIDVEGVDEADPMWRPW